MHEVIHEKIHPLYTIKTVNPFFSEENLIMNLKKVANFRGEKHSLSINPIALVSTTVAIALTSMFGSMTANAANLIDSTYGIGAGSFELGNFVNNGLGFMAVVPGNNTTITGWRVGGSGLGVDWLIENRFKADTGIHAIDLLKNTARSSISTIIPTRIGDTYQLSFATSTSSEFHNGSFTTQGFVSAGSLINQEFIVTTVSPTSSNQVYNFHNFEFIANDASTTITFIAGDPISAYGPVIDSVSVERVESVSEPLTILGAGTAIGLGASFKRKLKKGKNSSILIM